VQAFNRFPLGSAGNKLQDAVFFSLEFRHNYPHCARARAVLSRLTSLRKATCYGSAAPPRNTRNSGPPLPWGCPMPEAKTLWLPFVENFRISPGANAFSSATRRSPEGSKAIPQGSARSVANVLSVPSGANTRIASPPGPPSFPSVVTKRFPDRSKARPTGNWTPVKVAGPTRTLPAPAGVNLKIV